MVNVGTSKGSQVIMASSQDLSTLKLPYREPLLFMGGVPKCFSIRQIPSQSCSVTQEGHVNGQEVLGGFL